MRAKDLGYKNQTNSQKSVKCDNKYELEVQKSNEASRNNLNIWDVFLKAGDKCNIEMNPMMCL